MNESLIKEVATAEKIAVLPKVKGLYDVLFTITRKGLTRVEGDEWKHRRKLVSQVFNFDFITSHIPMMVKVANQVFQEF